MPLRRQRGCLLATHTPGNAHRIPASNRPNTPHIGTHTALHQHQDAWGLQVIGSVNVEPGARVDVKVELGGVIVYAYDGRADEFAPMELREALDRWSVEYMGDEAHYWRRPELCLWEIDKVLDPKTLLATSVRARNLPDAEAMLKESMSTPAKESDNSLFPMSDAPADWPEDDDALPV